MNKAACAGSAVEDCAGAERARQYDNLSFDDRQGRQHRFADPEQLSGLRHGAGGAGTGFLAAQSRRGLQSDAGTAEHAGGHKRPLHTIIPAFMEKGDVHIGFGIMGGWNQAQAHAQFVSNIVDFGMNIQAAMERRDLPRDL